MDVWVAKTSSNTGQQAQALASAWSHHLSLSHHHEFTPARVSRPKFRLKTYSTVVWLCAGGVSLILPDVRFGTISPDWVTYDPYRLQSKLSLILVCLLFIIIIGENAHFERWS